MPLVTIAAAMEFASVCAATSARRCVVCSCSLTSRHRCTVVMSTSVARVTVAIQAAYWTLILYFEAIRTFSACLRSLTCYHCHPLYIKGQASRSYLGPRNCNDAVQPYASHKGYTRESLNDSNSFVSQSTIEI